MYCFLKSLHIFVSDVSYYIHEYRGVPEGSGGKSIPVASIFKCVDVLIVRLILLTWRQEGRYVLTLCLFKIQCVYVHGFAVVFICAMFHVLFNIVCVGLFRGIIAKMLCICYRQGSIVIAVYAASFCFCCTRFSLPFPTSLIIMLLFGFMGQLKSWIRFKLVFLSVTDFLIWVLWW